MCKKVGTVFIACSKTKKQYACKARNMYQGALFKKALKYAELTHSSIFILSAKYGVLSLETIIEPYEKTLSKMNKKEKEIWYNKVKKQMIPLTPPFTFFTGSLYNQFFKGEKPLQGLSLGKQLQWFNQHLNINRKTLI